MILKNIKGRNYKKLLVAKPFENVFSEQMNTLKEEEK